MKIKSNTIAVAAVALLMAGSLALAGDPQDIAQNDGPNPGGGSRGRVVNTKGAGDDVVVVDRKFPFGAVNNRTDICGSLGENDKCRPRPLGDRGLAQSYSQYVGVCLPYPILGRTVCWGS